MVFLIFISINFHGFGENDCHDSYIICGQWFCRFTGTYKYCTTINIKFCELNRQWQPQKLLFESTYINETMIECFESLNKWIYFFEKNLIFMTVFSFAHSKIISLKHCFQNFCLYWISNHLLIVLIFWLNIVYLNIKCIIHLVLDEMTWKNWVNKKLWIHVCCIIFNNK